MGLKKAYYLLEDKYYALLDRINRFIPVYKIVDPIDRVVPSFVLLILLLVFLFLFLLSPWLSSLIRFGPQAHYATIRVLDSETSKPISGAEVTLTFVDSNKPISEKTDSDGKAKFDLGKEQARVSIEITAEGRQRYFKSEVVLVADQIRLFKLKHLEVALKEKLSLAVFDKKSKRKILDRPIHITFTCLGGGDIEPINAVQDEKVPFEVEDPGNCSSLLAKVSAQDFKSQTRPLSPGRVTEFFLESNVSEQNPLKGAIEITVVDQAESPVENVEVRLSNGTSKELKGIKYTGESGTVLFDGLSPGYYDALCTTSDGRTASEINIKVNAGTTTKQEIKLPALTPIEKKLFFKVVDASNSKPVGGAHAVIRADDLLFKSVDSNSDGTVKVPLSLSEADKNFTVVISADGYAEKFAHLPVLESSATSPVIINLSIVLDVNTITNATNLLPIALFVPQNNAYFGATPFTVSFDASASFDPDGSIVGYDWNFEPGSFASGSEKISVTHTFNHPGLYDVNLVVTDNNGAKGSRTVQIQVVQGKENWKPVAIVSANPFYGLVPLTVDFNAFESFDPDGSIVSYRWDFGDGENVSGVTKNKVTHTFASPGDFNVLLEVRDDDGDKALDRVLIQAYSESPENWKPVAIFSASSYYGLDPLSISFDASASFDPDGSIASFDWDFGDGEKASGVQVHHTFRSAGEFKVRLTVTDNKGATNSRDRNIEVIDSGINLNPIAVINASTLFGQKPLNVAFSASESFDPDGSIASFDWDFGDGNTATGETVLHTFSEDGNYTVKLTVVDNDGNLGSALVKVQVVSWPVPRYGDILVRVFNENLDPVEGALINLYREDVTHPLNDPANPVYSAADGSHLFENQEVSINKYFARAFYDPDLNGESEHRNVIAMQELELDVVLVQKTGNIEVFVADKNGPVENATVSFFSSSDNSLLDTCATSASGRCQSKNFAAGRLVLVSVSKAGYMTDQSNMVEVLANNTTTVNVLLSRTMSGVSAELDGIYSDVQCTSPAISIESLPDEKNYYYFKFRVKYGSNDNNDARFNMRTGLDLQSSVAAENYFLDVSEVFENSSDSTILSTCFNPAKPFEPPADCIGLGNHFKQAVLIWNELTGDNGVSKTVVVKVGVESGVADGTVTEAHFGAIASQNGTIVESGDIVIPITIGSPICASDGLAWQRFIELNGVKMALPVNPSPANFVELRKGKDYNLFFKVLNCTDHNIADLNIKVFDENEAGVVSFPGLGAGSGPFEVATLSGLERGILSGEQSFTIKAEKTAPKTVVKLVAEETDSQPKNGKTEMFFKVLSVNDLKVEGLPTALMEGIPINILGTVKDAVSDANIGGAVISILLNSSPLTTVNSASDGSFSYLQAGGSMPSVGDTVFVKINAPGYNELVVSIPVVSGGQPSLLDCVTINPVGPADVQKGNSGSFNVVSSNCPAAVEIAISSSLNVSPQNFTLQSTDSKEVQYTASGPGVFQGIYPVEVRGLVKGSASQRYIGTFEVRITDPNSCYSMDKFELDLASGTALATITNNCFFPNRDALNPFIGIDNSNVQLLKKAEKDNIPQSVSFTWHIRTYAENSDGSIFSVNSIERTSTVNPSYSKIVFVIAPFNADDFINGSDAEGITGIKESASYTGKTLLDVWFEPSSNNDGIEVWIEGNKVMARYRGKVETTGVYPLEIIKKFLAQTEYAFISIEDLVVGGGD